MALLRIKDLSVRYKDAPSPAVCSFWLQMEPGEIVGIVGESGSGKTTVLRSVLALLPGEGQITSGDILFEERSMLSRTAGELRAMRGVQLGVIFQDSGAMLNPIRRIGAQYVEAIRVHRPDMSREEAFRLGVSMLEKVRLSDTERVMKSYPFQLSGGMRQRVGIAMAMTFGPKLLLADEATSALDVTTQKEIVFQLEELRKRENTAILLVTHNMGVAAYLSDRIIVMKDGRVVDEGTTGEVMAHPSSDYTRKLLEAVPQMEGKRYV